MTQKNTQKELILQFLQDFGSITPRQAEDYFGCMRLASRIEELRRKGYAIITRTEHGRNRYGKRTSFARYLLGGDE